MSDKNYFGVPAGYSSDEESDGEFDGNFEAWFESGLGAPIKEALQTAMAAARGDLTDPRIISCHSSPQTAEGLCVFNDDCAIVGPSYVIAIAPVSNLFFSLFLFKFVFAVFQFCEFSRT